MNLNGLPIISVLSDCVTIVQKDGIKIVRVKHDKAEAGISLFGGHVVSFKPIDQQDVIWMSERAIFDGNTALRGGIPVCWPWFGRIAAPAHGFARSSEWQLIEHRENEQGVIVSLGLRPNDTTLDIWPHQFDAVLNMEVSECLKVSLTVTNTDSNAWTFSGALHSYFNIADINDTAITGMGDNYLDSLQSGKACLGGNALNFKAGVDRVYTQPQECIDITDPKHQRTITVKNQGDNAAVIWNPWELAINMGDMDDDGYQTMVCVESTLHAPSLEQGKTLQPGESHTLSTEIGIKA
ncbi:D-hexose-6-phosphate mutarotase [Vibrio sp. S11_S32]|uniref:D-hexose-6-phosphate mutarotase n=1 Tax=Vibrio sp. S11_S32 TaxID=2720225 RepID=UPI001681233D|nr:D-hexose-6-phosphate mutarotase [Vibrio sp. S11_S32]MBD1574921.1 D-hexose-6-phosphate mutarotase [Vibrio sp. S11_S32]